MGQISLSIPQTGQPNTTEDPKVASDLTTLQTVINGNLDSTNIAAALAQSAMVNQSGQAVKGVSNVSTSQSVTSTTFTTLATPDAVSVVLPANGLLEVFYTAMWQGSSSGATISAAIFVGANQEKTTAVPSPGTNGISVILGVTGTQIAVNTAAPLYSDPSSGLSSTPTQSAYTGNVTTGQIIQPCYLFAAAGTYNVTIQFKSTAGSVTVSNRTLWVRAHSFA